ncbi:MAG: hypothetical protein WBL68_07680 [Nitrososphaeraceae archaeon]
MTPSSLTLFPLSLLVLLSMPGTTYLGWLFPRLVSSPSQFFVTLSPPLPSQLPLSPIMKSLSTPRSVVSFPPLPEHYPSEDKTASTLLFGHR